MVAALCCRVVNQQTPQTSTDLTARLAAALERIGEAARVLLRSAATAENVSSTQAQLLLRVSGTGAEAADSGIGALARWLDVSAPTASDATSALERKGLIARRVDQPDGRKVEVAPTARGAEVALRLRAWDQPLQEALAATATAGDFARAPADAAMLDRALATIAELQRAGVIKIARTCRGCRFFDTSHSEGAPYWCHLLAQQLEPATLRIDCAEYQAS